MNLTKMVKHSLLLLIVSLSILSCSKKKGEEVTPASNELENLQLVTTLSNNNHKIELYTANGKFQTGYNAIFFQLKNTDGSLVNNATVSWKPLMHMTMMSHACPSSAITKKENAQSTYAGYLVFQMASNDSEYWELTLNYEINGAQYTSTGKVQVTAAPKQTMANFKGSDNKNYILAMVAPTAPRVGVNDMKAVLYQAKSMTDFVVADNYKIKIDPRMPDPGMGNHGSPNNVDLIQGADKMYQGKLNLTMTGYWKVNLQVFDAANQVLKGEEVTPSNAASPLYFELEF